MPESAGRKSGRKWGSEQSFFLKKNRPLFFFSFFLSFFFFFFIWFSSFLFNPPPTPPATQWTPPQPAAISRKRAFSGPTQSSDDKPAKVKVSAKTRVAEHPNSGLSVDNAVLFCDYCRKEVDVKESTIKSHLASDAHKKNAEVHQKAAQKSQSIARAFQEYKEANEGRLPSGSTLSGEHMAFRSEVLKVFLKSGTPLHRLRHFRFLLEKAGFSLTTESHLC